MGLDYSYLLYFRREDIWNVLQAVVEIAVPFDPPTKIQLTDGELVIPLDAWTQKDRRFTYKDAEMNFSISINFEEDDAIIDYLIMRNNDYAFPAPTEGQSISTVPIGYIYLTIRNETSNYYPAAQDKDIVTFDFGTTGTKMSMLFYESESIRRTFVGLLERVQGICGVFNQEDYGTLFWYKGKLFDQMIDNPFMLPSEIETELNLR
jgi:hypothetical protein